MTSKLSRLTFAFLAVAPALAFGVVPETVSFSARIADNGRPVTGAHSFTFKFWDCNDADPLVCVPDDPEASPPAPSPNVLWRETQTGVPVVEGVVGVVLGADDGVASGTGVDNTFSVAPTLFNGQPRWLEVSMDGTPFGPRLALHSVPFAFRAGAADAADSLVSGSTVWNQSTFQSTGTINNASNPVDWTKLKTVPAGFADGVDNDTLYSAGAGLSQVGTAFSANYAGTGGNYGSLNSLARSDHAHGVTTNTTLLATIGTTATDCNGGGASYWHYESIPSTWPAAPRVDRSFEVRYHLANASAACRYYYLNAQFGRGAGGSATFWYAAMQATHTSATWQQTRTAFSATSATTYVTSGAGGAFGACTNYSGGYVYICPIDATGWLTVEANVWMYFPH